MESQQNNKDLIKIKKDFTGLILILIQTVLNTTVSTICL